MFVCTYLCVYTCMCKYGAFIKICICCDANAMRLNQLTSEWTSMREKSGDILSLMQSNENGWTIHIQKCGSPQTGHNFLAGCSFGLSHFIIGKLHGHFFFFGLIISYNRMLYMHILHALWELMSDQSDYLIR